MVTNSISRLSAALRQLLSGLFTILCMPFRLLPALSSALLMALLAVVVAIMWLLGTSAGARFALQTGDRVLDDIGISAAEVDGYLLGELRLRQVRLEMDGQQQQIEHIRLHWQPAGLLRMRLQVKLLEVSDVSIKLAATEAPTEPEPTVLPESLPIPLQLFVKRLHVQRVQWQIGETPAQSFEDLQGDNIAWEDQQLSADRLYFAGFNAAAEAADIQLFTGNKTVETEVEAATAIDAEVWPFFAKLDWRYNLDAERQFSGNGSVQGDMNLISLQLQLKGLVQAQLLGNVAQVLQNPELDLTAEIASMKLQALSGNKDLPESLRGDLQLKGRPENMRVSADLRSRVSIPDQPDIAALDLRVKLSADVTPEKASLQRLSIEQAGKTRLQAKGDVQWQPELTAALTLQVNELLLQPFLPGMQQIQAGDVINADAQLEWHEKGRSAITLHKLSGQLHGAPLSGKLQLVLPTANRLQLKQLQLDWASAKLRANGTVDQLDSARPLAKLSAELAIPELRKLHSDSRGVINLSATVDGRIPQGMNSIWRNNTLHWDKLPLANVNLDVQKLQLLQYSVEQLNLVLNLMPKGSSSLQLDGRALLLADEQIEQLQLRFDGQPEAHQLAMSVKHREGSSELLLSGSLQQQRWQAQLQQLLLQPALLPPWQLQQPAGLQLDFSQSQMQADISNICLLAGEKANAISNLGSVCVTAGSSAEGQTAAVQLNTVSVDYIKSLLPANLGLKTSLSGELALAMLPQLNSQTAKIQVTGALKIAAGSVQNQELDAPPLLFGDGQASVQLEDNQLNASLLMPLSKGQIEGQLQHEMLSGAIRGDLNAEITDLTGLGALSNEVEDLSGQFSAGLNIGGTVKAPDLRGQVVLSQLHASLPLAGIELKNSDVKISSTGGKQFDLVAKLFSGDGEINLSGQAEPLATPVKADLSIKGSQFLALAGSEAKVWISPDVQATLRGDLLDLTGTLVVPRAEITPRLPANGTAAVMPTSDQVIVGDDDLPTAEGLKLRNRLQLVLGDQVTVVGLGLKTRLAGSLRTLADPGGSTRASGELNLLEGSYKALGQDLNIESGRLIFTGGPIEEPGIDLRATRTAVDGTVAGVLVRGPVQTPKLQIFSEPPLPTDVALSYLVTGRPPSQRGGGSAQDAAISAATNALASRGADFLTSRIGDRLGFEQFELQTSDTLAQSALVIGRYLTPKLYVSYGVGVVDGESALKLRYELGRQFSIETQSAEEDSVELLYTIERD